MKLACVVPNGLICKIAFEIAQKLLSCIINMYLILYNYLLKKKNIFDDIFLQIEESHFVMHSMEELFSHTQTYVEVILRNVMYTFIKLIN